LTYCEKKINISTAATTISEAARGGAAAGGRPQIKARRPLCTSPRTEISASANMYRRALPTQHNRGGVSGGAIAHAVAAKSGVAQAPLRNNA